MSRLSDYMDCPECGKQVRYYMPPNGVRQTIEGEGDRKNHTHDCIPELKGIPKSDPEYDYMLERMLECRKRTEQA
ncbi:hypothetical protein F4X90_20555 [Candidatus Poribacteria bacterium]|nr:hypothetical protein [Candidatus Poribacteria bacterium]